MKQPSRSRVPSILFVVAALGAPAACKDPAPAATSTAASADPSTAKKAPPAAASDSAKAGEAKPAASTSASASPSGKGAKKAEPPKKSEPKALSADEKKGLAAYQKAMNDGRKATREKKTDDAVAAFDLALKAIPDDARAYGERGYARILAKDFKAGLADLDKAAAHTGDKKLLGQIWFNYGLAAEGVGDAEKARAAFARSNAYNPTKAAKDKLAGKLACAATLDEADDDRAHVYDDWKAAYEAQREDTELPEWSGDASLKSLCGDDWKKGQVCVRAGGNWPIWSGRALLQRADGKIVSHDLGVAGGRCGGSVEPKVVDRADGIVHVRTVVEQGLTVYVAENKAGEIVDCAEGMDCMSACADPERTFVDSFIEEATGKVLFTVTREAIDGEKDPLAVTRAGKDVEVKGAGCDRKLTLATKG